MRASPVEPRSSRTRGYATTPAAALHGVQVFPVAADCPPRHRRLCPREAAHCTSPSPSSCPRGVSPHSSLRRPSKHGVRHHHSEILLACVCAHGSVSHPNGSCSPSGTACFTVEGNDVSSCPPSRPVALFPYPRVPYSPGVESDPCAAELVGCDGPRVLARAPSRVVHTNPACRSHELVRAVVQLLGLQPGTLVTRGTSSSARPGSKPSTCAGTKQPREKGAHVHDHPYPLELRRVGWREGRPCGRRNCVSGPTGVSTQAFAAGEHHGRHNDRRWTVRAPVVCGCSVERGELALAKIIDRR